MTSARRYDKPPGSDGIILVLNGGDGYMGATL